MKGTILVLVLAAALMVAFGCAGPQISTKEEPKKNVTAPPVQEEKKTPPSPPPEPAAEEQNAAPPAVEQSSGLAPDQCIVEFQKDPTGIYYLMVKTDSPKELFVRCPNYKLAEKKGSLYFCESVDTGEPAVAYLDLKECGRAYFDRASQETKNAAGSIGCWVSVAPARIVAGQTSVVTIWTSSGDKKITVSYNCGEKVESESRTGMVSNSKICQFDTAGTTFVYADVDGKPCASKLLEVFSSPKDCSVYGSRLERAKSEYVYTAKVAGRGYSGGDDLSYRCYDVSNSRPLRDAVSTPADFVTAIECRGKEPLYEPVKVKVADNNCGELDIGNATAAQ